jgi:fluoroquinolone resistance protein
MQYLNRLESRNSYTGDQFKRLDLKNVIIREATFCECRFLRCDFSEALLQSCRFMDCTFEDCTMKMINVEDTAFIRVKFSQCNLLGVDWTQASWSDWAAKTGSLEFEHCNLQYAGFLGLNLRKMKLKNCTAHETMFAESNLSEADFEGTDFTGAVFLRTNLTGANFVGAKNYTLNVNDNKTKGARFSLPEAIRLLYYMDIELVDPQTNESLDDDSLSNFM